MITYTAFFFFIQKFWIFYRLSLKDTNLRTEPKHIVFLTELLLLFKLWHICKYDNPLVDTKEIDTEAVIKTLHQPKMQERRSGTANHWCQSQGYQLGTFSFAWAFYWREDQPPKCSKCSVIWDLAVSLKTFFKCQKVRCVSNIPLMRVLLLSFTRCFSILHFSKCINRQGCNVLEPGRIRQLTYMALGDWEKLLVGWTVTLVCSSVVQ